jgi:hypothetical protein
MVGFFFARPELGQIPLDAELLAQIRHYVDAM